MLDDIDFTSTLNKCKEKLVNSCGDYVSSEFAFERVIKNPAVQVVVPLVLAMAAVVILKPDWSLVPGTQDRDYVKISLMSVSIYIVVIFAIVAAKAYFFPS